MTAPSQLPRLGRESQNYFKRSFALLQHPSLAACPESCVRAHEERCSALLLLTSSLQALGTILAVEASISVIVASAMLLQGPQAAYFEPRFLVEHIGEDEQQWEHKREICKNQVVCVEALGPRQ